VSSFEFEYANENIAQAARRAVCTPQAIDRRNRRPVRSPPPPTNPEASRETSNFLSLTSVLAARAAVLGYVQQAGEWHAGKHKDASADPVSKSKAVGGPARLRKPGHPRWKSLPSIACAWAWRRPGLRGHRRLARNLAS